MAHWFMTKEMKFDNVNSEVSYDKVEAYGQSKLANVLFASELAKRLKETGVTANSLHPGAVSTELSQYIHPMIQKPSRRSSDEHPFSRIRRSRKCYWVVFCRL